MARKNKRKVPITQRTNNNNNNNKKQKKKNKQNNNDDQQNNTNKDNIDQKTETIEINWEKEPLEIFKWLIHPITPQVFFTEYWEKKPLIVKRKNKDYYKKIFSKQELDEILKTKNIFFKRNINICRCEDGVKVMYDPLQDEQNKIIVDKKPNLDSNQQEMDESEDLGDSEDLQHFEEEQMIKMESDLVWDLYDKQGYTLQFLQPQQHSDFAKMLMSKLETFFGCLVVIIFKSFFFFFE